MISQRGLKLALPLLAAMCLLLSLYVVTTHDGCGGFEGGHYLTGGPPQLLKLKPGLARRPKQDKPSVNTREEEGSINNRSQGVRQDSENAAVLAMATNYDLETHRIFVGSLRRSGFKGSIILAVEPDLSEEIHAYLTEQNVTMKVPTKTLCTYRKPEGEPERPDDSDDDDELRTCYRPYPYLKQRWARFPLLRDYLRECARCTGPALFTDYRDTYFQCNPFSGEHFGSLEELQLFREHESQRTTHWLVDGPVSKCKNVRFDEPMLCSGTTIGTRNALLSYANAMHEEMKAWMEDEKCCCNDMVGDDQSIHNYLHYAGRFNFSGVNTVAVRNRVGIVHTVGLEGSNIHQAHTEAGIAKGLDRREAEAAPYDGSDQFAGRWLGSHYNLTDAEGYLTNFDESRSCVVHQYDRLGPQFDSWLKSMEGKIWAPSFDCPERNGSRGGEGKTPQDQTKKVFVFPEDYVKDEFKHIFLDGIAKSDKLERTYDMYDPEAYWFVDLNRVTEAELETKWKQQMECMIEYHRQRRNAEGADYEHSKSHQKIILVDWSDSGWDEGILSSIFALCARYFGKGNVHYVTRQHVDSREIVIDPKNEPVPFEGLGDLWQWDGGAQHGLGGKIEVARYSVRSDLVDSISEVVKETKDALGGMDPIKAIPMLRRPKDVVTFWNASHDIDPVSGVRSYLRAAVSRAVLSLANIDSGDGGARQNITVTAKVCGKREHEGRNDVHDDYVMSLLEHKIVVVAQRDQWEGHYRLMEALAGGALVFTDPMHPLPYLLEDGVNVVVYNSISVLKKKILYYIEDAQGQKERVEIAARGHAVAMNHHRSWHVMERLILGNLNGINYPKAQDASGISRNIRGTVAKTG